MPKGKRYKKTLNGYTYDLSEGQFLLLRKPVFRIKLDPDWPTTQRVNSLVKQGLFFKSRNGSSSRSTEYVRSTKGLKLYEALKANLNSPTK